MDVCALLDELRILATNGLTYADNPYDRERYERILELVSEWYGRSVDLPPEELRTRFAEEAGHVTPKVGTDVAVFGDRGRILLQHRADDDTWGLPGGYVDPCESPRETAVREAREETGLAVEPVEFVGVYTRKPGQYGPHCLVVHLYRCTRTRGELRNSHEGTDLRYRPLEEVTDWHKNHRLLARQACESWRDSE